MKMETTVEQQSHSPAGPLSPGSPAPAPRPGSTRSNRPRRRRWLPYSGAALLLALLVAGFWPRPVPVETVQVRRGPVQATVNEEGRTRLKQRYIVSAPVSGQLRRIPFKSGAPIAAGQTVLAVIDPLTPAMLDARARALAEARAQTARATLERARAARDFAASELARVQALYSEKAVSAQELESAQWRETSSAKELAAAQSSLREAEAELLDFAAADSGAARPPVEIKAQVSGSVLRVFEESSRAVSAGAPLLEIGDPRDLEVVVEVLSRDGAIIPPGARVELHQWGGPDPLQAVVRLVEPSAFTKVSALGVEEQRVNVVADILTPPDRRPGLGDAFRVEARIVTAEAPDALKISSGALFRAQGGWAAFLLQNGRAQTKPVTVGLTSGSEMQILGGLQEGDTVVLYPGDRVRDGQRVQPISLSPQP